MKKVELLETTLRDGGYAINFSFTAADTGTLCHELELAGFRYIEIGHGISMNGSNSGYGRAFATDEEYMTAAEAVLKKAKYGMFCQPTIAGIEDIDLAHRHGMGFIRIGTNVTQVEKSEQFIKRAKDCGMLVTSNFMKSYALSPKEFAKKVLLSESYGSDIVYLVDSAGGMFPDDIKNFYEAIRKESSIKLGFHGHDNLGLAVANSLIAADLGFSIIDCSLQGLGRSSGNATTEIIIAALKKRGYDIPIDLRKTFEIGQTYINPLIKESMRMPLDIVAGFCDFHSSYMPKIQKYSAKYKVDPILLMIELTKVDRINAPDELIEKLAQDIKRSEKSYLVKYGFKNYYGGEQDDKSPKSG